MSHILIRCAKKYPTPKPLLASESSYYDLESGYWRLMSNGLPMMLDGDSPRPTSKKYDRETGEDMKGE